MVRCKRCGTENYAIDMWCSKCSQHLDWAPPEPVTTIAPESEPIAPAAVPVMSAAAVEPPAQSEPVAAAPAAVPVAAAAVEPPPAAAVEPPPAEVVEPASGAPVDPSPAPVADARPSRRRAAVWLLPAAAALLVAALVAFPVAGWLKSAAHQSAAALQLPLTVAVVGDTPTASPTASPMATPEATPSPTDSPAPVPAPAPAQPPAEQPVQPVPAIITTAGDPASAIAAFYRAVAAHNFDAAAATWSAQMQAAYPPPEYINHRFAYTQQMNLRTARTVANNGQVSTVYIDLIEVYAGTTRHWVGTWQLVRDSSGWLLNQPNLRAAG